MSELILSLNAGSSSLKFGLYRRDGGELHRVVTRAVPAARASAG